MKKFSLLFIFSLCLSASANAKLVGVTIDYRKNQNDEHKFAETSFYGMRDNYISAFQNSCKKYGVTVLPIPLDKSMIKNYSEIFDGIVFSGNYYDIDPALYGQKVLNQSVKNTDTSKTNFETLLFQNFYKTKKPIFGICGGYQMMNVMLGGALYQDIPTQIKETKINHSGSGKKCIHDVKVIEEEGVFAGAVEQSASEKEKICVNSTHHQAISKIAKDLEVTITATDGVIEAYKNKNHPFMIGVQWHPEYELTKFDSALIDRFCREVAGK